MYLDLGEPETVLLRTHTSPVQIHLMEEAVRTARCRSTPSCPGKCFRLDTPDARHLPVFNQIEGLVVDRDITFGDLAGTIQTFTEAYFGEGMQSRLRPAYFPFTEPSAEFEITCTHLPGRGLPHVLADRLDRAGRLRDGRPGRVRRGRASTPTSGRASPSASASTGWPRCAMQIPDMRVLPRERHPLPLAVLSVR